MKKIISLFSVITMLLVMCPTTAFADEFTATDRCVEYFEDGSYIVTEITTSSITTMATKTTTQSKSSHYYNSSNNKEWTITLTGTFNYTGSSATCTKAVTSYKIYNDDWKVTSAVPSKSGNEAIGKFTVKKYALGIPVKTVNWTINLHCNNYGVCA